MLSVSSRNHTDFGRSVTPDGMASDSWEYNNGLREESTLDWTTANTLERHRKRESSESNCSSDNVHMPVRSRSLSSRPEPDGNPWSGPAAFYIDKNGRARQLGGSPAIPSQWMDSDSNSDCQMLDNDAINASIKKGYKLDKEFNGNGIG